MNYNIVTLQFYVIRNSCRYDMFACEDRSGLHPGLPPPLSVAIPPFFPSHPLFPPFGVKSA